MNVYWITSLLIYFNLKFKQYIILIVNILSMNFIYDSLHLEKKRKEEFYISLAIEIMHLHYGKITATDMHRIFTMPYISTVYWLK